MTLLLCIKFSNSFCQLFDRQNVSQSDLYQLNYTHVDQNTKEAFLSYNPNFTNEIYENKNFINKFGISAEKIVTNVSFNRDSLLNGFMYMQLYRHRADEKPSYFLWCNFDNGVANGIGYLYENEENNFPLELYGIWENGQFSHKNDIDSLALWAFNNFNYQTYFNIPEIRNKSFKVQNVIYNQDPLNEELENSLYFCFEIHFTLNGPHWFSLCVTKNDFLSDLAVRYGGGDNFIHRRYEGYQVYDMLQGAVNNTLKYLNSGGGRDYGDKIRVYVDPWDTYNIQDCRSFSEQANDPLNSYSQESKHSKDESTTATIYFREDANAEFVKASSYILFHKISCDGSDYYFITNDETTGSSVLDIALATTGFNVKKTFDSEEEAIKYFINEASTHNKQYYSLKNNENEIMQKKYNQKLGLLIDRIKSTNFFAFDSTDLTSGIWYSESQNALFVRSKYLADKFTYYRLNLSYKSIFNPKGYQNSFTKYNVLIGNTNTPAYTGVTKERIYFMNKRDEWVRINPY